jgi:hypothetical protein
MYIFHRPDDGRLKVETCCGVKLHLKDMLCSVPVHCTDEQHAMSAHELQSALKLTVEFSKMYYTR